MPNKKTEVVPTEFGPCRVLVADDEHLVASGIASALRDLGHEVVGVAPDGETAVAIARELRPDIAVLDIRMPKMNGTEVALLIFEELSIPSLIISAYADEEYVTRIQGYGTASGVYGYLLKPAGMESLRVSLAVARQRAAVDAYRTGRIAQLEKNLVNRRTVEQAKWKLIEQQKLTEPAAHDKLQRMARDRRQPLVEIAKAVLEGDGLIS